VLLFVLLLVVLLLIVTGAAAAMAIEPCPNFASKLATFFTNSAIVLDGSMTEGFFLQRFLCL
jgi:hypothetical protein